MTTKLFILFFITRSVVAQSVISMGSIPKVTADSLWQNSLNISQGVCPFQSNAKWGYVGEGGKIVIPFMYDDASIFEHGLACVSINGKSGWINRSNRIMIPFAYDKVVKRMQLVSPRGGILVSFVDGLAAVEKEGKYGYINTKGKIVIPFNYDFACAFENGMARVKLNDKWGWIDKTGKQLVACIYENVGSDFSVDETDGICQESADFVNGFSAIKKEGKWGFVNEKGIEILCQYDAVDAFYSKYFARVQLNGKWGLINARGTKIVACEYDKMEITSSQFDLFKIKLDDKLGWIDRFGKFVIPCIYDDVMEGTVKNEGNIKQLVEPYDEELDFVDGMACIKKNDKWGYINSAGKIMIPFIYEQATAFEGGQAHVKLNGVEKVISRFGRLNKAAKDIK